MIREQYVNTTGNLRVFIFCLIIFQSIGIRFLEGQGTVLAIIIIILSFKSLNELNKRDYKFLFVSVSFLFLCKLFNPAFLFPSLFFQISLIVSSYLFLVQYRGQPEMLQKEFTIALKLFTIHAFIGYILFLLMPHQFVAANPMNKSLFSIFYVSNSNSVGIQRNTGLFWEPGVLQLIANLYLFYCIKTKENIGYVIIAALTVLSSFSTIGLIILVINIGYFMYLKIRNKEISVVNSILLITTLTVFSPILINNASEKMDGDNTSGLIRMRDINIGMELIKEKPILGHGYFNGDYLGTKGYVNNIEYGLFSEEFLSESGSMGGGYTNGFLGLIAWYGIPMSFLLYFFYFKNEFVDEDIIERLLFCLIPLLSMISEPISYTSLFLIFPFSYYILNDKPETSEIVANSY